MRDRKILFLVAACLVACGSIVGLPDDRVPDDATVDGGGEAGSEGGALPDGAPTGDDGGEGGSGGCAVGACVEQPTGWTIVAYADSQSTPCPSGYGAAIDAKSVSSSACNCDCPTTPAICQANVAFYGDNACGTTPGTVDAGTACQALSVTTEQSAQVTGTTTAPAQCGTPNPAKTPIADARRCPAAGASCGTNGVCVPALAGGTYAQCYSHPGDVACPLPNQNRLHVGDVTSDTRSCGACTCSPPATPCGTVDLFTDTSCDNGKLTVAPTTCTPVAANTYHAVRFHSSGSCSGTDPPVTGSVTLQPTTDVTVCCPNN